MKPSSLRILVAIIVVLIAVPAEVYAQAKFNIPFKFKAGGKNLPAGEYWVGLSGEKQITMRQVTTGKELQITFTGKLSPTEPPYAEPQLVFDEVGDFAPSYTEYLTVYVLSEVWLTGKDGFEVHVTRGAHKHKNVPGVKADK